MPTPFFPAVTAIERWFWKPSTFKRFLIIIAQGIFYNAFFLLYLLSNKTAHRIVGYLEEEAVYSYTEYLEGVDSGKY